MPTTSSGLFFVAKNYPCRDATSTHNDGEGNFVLKVRVLDNQGPQRVEAYVVRWAGAEAQAWWAAHGPLKAGDALALDLVNPRSFMGLRSPEIHATVTRCQLLPARAAAITSRQAAQPGVLTHAS